MSEIDIQNKLALERAKARKNALQNEKQSSGYSPKLPPRYQNVSAGNISALRSQGKGTQEDPAPEALEAENLLARRRALLAYRKLQKEGNKQSAEYVKNKAFRTITNRWKIISWATLFNIETLVGPILALLYLNLHALASMFGKGDKFKMNILEYVGVLIADLIVGGIIAGIVFGFLMVIEVATNIFGIIIEAGKEAVGL